MSEVLVTRVGKIELWVPQDRAGRFSTEVFERYQRSEKALAGALTEMYLQGVSTSKVKAISEELCGPVAIGIDWQGRRQVLGVKLANRDSRRQSPQDLQLLACART